MKACNWKHKVFLELYIELDGQSCISGTPVSNPQPINFHHGLAKSAYGSLMYERRNIFFMTDEEHGFAHNMTLNSLRKRIASGEKWLEFLCAVRDVFDEYSETEPDYKVQISRPKILNFIEELN